MNSSQEDSPAKPEAPPDTAEIKGAIDQFMRTFKTFHDQVDSKLDQMKKSINKKTADVVTTEHVDRLNDALDDQKKLIDDLRLQNSRPMIELPNGQKAEITADQIAHKKAFEGYFRKGIDSGLGDLQQKALSVGVDPDGGYLAPVEMEATIDRILSEVSPIRAISTVRQIGANSYKKIVNRAGTTSGWVGETGSRPETDIPVLSELEFPVMELYAEPRATQTLLDDSMVNIEQWLADEVQIEFAEEEGKAFVDGTGVAQPRGILSYDKVADANYSWGRVGYIATGAAGAFNSNTEGDDVDNLLDLVYALQSGYRNGARFVMNRLTQKQIRKIKDADGNPTWQPGLQSGQPATLLGYGITEAEDMPDMATDSFSIAFGDFRRGYMVVDRVGIRVLRDPFTAKPYVKFYTTKRVGGGIQMFEAIKLMKFGVS